MSQYGHGHPGGVDGQQPPAPLGAFGPPPPAFVPGQHQPPVPQYSPPAPQPGYHPATPEQLLAPGPEFLATDAHFGVVIDASGVSFDADGNTAEFGWGELLTVQFKPSPVGRRLMVAAVLPDGRFFECVVNARKAAVLQQWLGEIGYVVGHYLAARGYPNNTP